MLQNYFFKLQKNIKIKKTIKNNVDKPIYENVSVLEYTK